MRLINPYKLGKLIAGHSKYSGDSILAAIYCMAQGKEINKPITPLDEERPKGKWIRMSNLSEQEDDRYKCSNCGNVVHYKDKINLYTFNSWCGRCGSDNGKEKV